MNALQESPMFSSPWPVASSGAMRMPLMPLGGAMSRCCPSAAPQMPQMPQGAAMGQDVLQAEMQMLTQLMGILTSLLAGFMLNPQAGGAFGGGNRQLAGGTANASPAGNVSGASPSSSARPATGADLSGTSALGRSITQDALAHTNSTPGLCLKNVGAVLRREGIKCGPAPSAYMVDQQLASNKNMKEVKVPSSELKNLPAGAVIVWERSSNLPDGHISISLGDGREWSGPIRKQMNLGTSYRVFLPQ